MDNRTRPRRNALPLQRLGWRLGLLTLMAFAAACDQQEEQRPQVKCLHAAGEQYKAFAWLVCSHLQDKLGHSYRISVERSLEDGHLLSGAMDIIDAVARHSDRSTFLLGLTQSDVAYYFRRGGHPLYEMPHAHHQRVVALARTFPEYLHVYSTPVPERSFSGATADHDLNVLLDEVEHSWETLYLGELGSGTLITSVNVFPVLSERPLHPTPQTLTQRHEFLPHPEAVGLTPTWGGTYVSGFPAERITALLRDLGGTLVSLKPSQERHLNSVFSMFYYASDIVYPGRDNHDIEARAVSVPALLVASEDLPHDVALEVRSFLELLDAQGPNELVPSTSGIEMPDDLTEGAVAHVVRAAQEYRGNRFADLPLPLHRRIALLHTENYRWPLVILIASLIVLIIAIREVLHSKKGVSSFFELPFSTSLVVFGSFAIAWFAFALLGVFLLEYWAFITYRVDRASPFLLESFDDLMPRILYYVASGFSYDAIFPAGKAAQALWLSIPLAIVASALGGLGRALLPKMAELISKASERKVKMKLAGHIVICNWHPLAESVIRMLGDHTRIEGSEPENIVVVTVEPERFEAPRLGQSRHEELGDCIEFAVPPRAGEKDNAFAKFFVVAGNPRESAVLRTLKVATAKAVLVFPEPEHVEPDSATLLLIVRIRKEIDEGSGDGRDEPRLIAWCEDPKNSELFLDPAFRLTDVCSAEWAWRMMCQATYLEHASDIYRRLLTSTANTNEVYDLVLPDDWKEISFGEVQERLVRLNEGAPTVPTEDRSSSKRNTVLLLGYARPSERWLGSARAGAGGDAGDGSDWEARRDDGLHLNPNLDELVKAGDRLLLLTYSFGTEARERLLAALQRPNEAPGTSTS